MTYTDLNYLREVLETLRAREENDDAIGWCADIIEDIIKKEQ